jgi:hypothetical protein
VFTLTFLLNDTYMAPLDQLPSDFFTPASFATLATASAIVLVSSTALRKVFSLDPVKTTFIVAQLIAFVGGFGTQRVSIVMGVFIAFFNGCLLFCTVTGLHDVAVTSQPTGGARPHAKGSFTWREAWRRPWIGD